MCECICATCFYYDDDLLCPGACCFGDIAVPVDPEDTCDHHEPLLVDGIEHPVM